VIDLDKVCEGIDYELVPVEDNPNSQAWHIRILKGDFTETVISMGNVALADDADEPYLKFNFSIITTPDSTLTEEDISLQDYAATILEDIMERGIADGSVVVKEK